MTKEKDPNGKIFIIGGSIANFTDVAATFAGLIKAIQAYEDVLRAHHVSNVLMTGFRSRCTPVAVDDIRDSTLLAHVFYVYWPSHNTGQHLGTKGWAKLSRGLDEYERGIKQTWTSYKDLWTGDTYYRRRSASSGPCKPR